MFEEAGGLKLVSIGCIFILFKGNCVLLASTASAKSLSEFFCNDGSSTLRQPTHLQFSEQGIFAYGKKYLFII